ncbi:phosphonate C-P lyase system protein PhnH [Rhodococcus chondri]|uniref:Phosphonate C-P lyase system protein PhnH n=1 Tax=Rhodococcus chondri TaxID=3065941 RepID=A0ABU7JVD0_9NOCA|nr:phosphonate C-P lyase system protein PhnH [Rhodococcus sp. CC-R104]MEE2033479.1 phosphonate C-P lyase system protein PhnH [Rhodococcus sp. CC-R104]
MTTTDSVLGVGLDPVVAQRVYRSVLDAFTRPGRVRTLPDTEFPPALLPALALADLETGVTVLEADDTDWSEVLAVATGAPVAAAAHSKYVTVLRPVAAEDLATADRGCALSPESAATVVCAIPSLDGGVPVTLTGPGIAETEAISPQGFDEALWNARAVATADFPAGIDLLLVADDGTMLGVPRTTRVRTGQEN